MITIPAWIAWLILGLGAGVGGTIGARAIFADDDAPETIEAVATVVEAVTEEHVTEAETKQIVASMDAASIAVQAALEHDAKPADVALAMYALAVQGAMAKEEGASALEVKMAAEALVKEIGEMQEIGPVVERPTLPIETLSLLP
jgi:predicted TIM-barrel enzyme